MSSAPVGDMPKPSAANWLHLIVRNTKLGQGWIELKKIPQCLFILNYDQTYFIVFPKS